MPPNPPATYRLQTLSLHLSHYPANMHTAIVARSLSLNLKDSPLTHIRIAVASIVIEALNSASHWHEIYYNDRPMSNLHPHIKQLIGTYMVLGVISHHMRGFPGISSTLHNVKPQRLVLELRSEVSLSLRCSHHSMHDELEFAMRLYEYRWNATNTKYRFYNNTEDTVARAAKNQAYSDRDEFRQKQIVAFSSSKEDRHSYSFALSSRTDIRKSILAFL